MPIGASRTVRHAARQWAPTPEKEDIMTPKIITPLRPPANPMKAAMTPYEEGYAAGHASKPRSNPYLKGWASQSEVSGWMRLGLRADVFIWPEQWEQGYRAGLTTHAANTVVR